MAPGEVAFVLVAASAAFTLSAAAGLGGSLLLVPAMALVLGAKEGVALAALLLAMNNVVKLSAYRAWVPWRPSLVLAALTACGAALGARLLVDLPERWVVVAVLVSVVVAFGCERSATSRQRPATSRWRAAAYAAASGATSGASGTSGPLKGVAIRAWIDDRLGFVAAASVVSLVGDLVKSAVYLDAGVLQPASAGVLALAVPVMIGATLAGRRMNVAVGEKGYSILFWLVLGGYSGRLVLGLA